jgi:hypothetical protein
MREAPKAGSFLRPPAISLAMTPTMKIDVREMAPAANARLQIEATGRANLGRDLGKGSGRRRGRDG